MDVLLNLAIVMNHADSGVMKTSNIRYDKSPLKSMSSTLSLVSSTHGSTEVGIVLHLSNTGLFLGQLNYRGEFIVPHQRQS
jgi:hypothetical protein